MNQVEAESTRLGKGKPAPEVKGPMERVDLNVGKAGVRVVVEGTPKTQRGWLSF